MGAPASIAEDPIASKPRCDELGHAAVAAIGEHATMALTEHLDGRAAIVNRVVAIARTTRVHRNDVQISATHEDLRVAGPSVVLRPRSGPVITRWDQCPIDDPRLTTIAVRCVDESGQARRHGRHDAVRRRLRDREARGQLADRQVRTQGGTRDHHAATERARPWPAASGLARQSLQHGAESGSRERREQAHSRIGRSHDA